MNKISLAVGVGVVLMLGIVAVMTTTSHKASAYASPHEGAFSVTTFDCGGCHRTHTAEGEGLLVTSQENLCQSCHDGTGADTNVVDGVYLGTSNGTYGAGLKGGGFNNAMMDTNADGSVVSTAITSRHSIEGASTIAWGSGAINATADYGETIGTTFACSNCHNPHGNSQYRLLRPKPNGLVTDAPATDVVIPASLETTKIYTISYDTTTHYSDLSKYSSTVLTTMSQWCVQCHTRYNATSDASGHTNSGDAVFKYRHQADGTGTDGKPLYCASCHVAHGTSASMSGQSTGVIWPNGSTLVTWQSSIEGQDSRLLTLDNRGVCIQCHGPGSGLNTN